MTADAALSRELNSLQEELSTSQSHRERPSPLADRTPVRGETAEPVERPEDSIEGQGLQKDLRDFINVITGFVEDAEKNVSAHPTANMLGSLVVGILIGRLLGRR